MDLDELYEICYECTGYGDDYYFDKETGEYESACEDCLHSKPKNNKPNHKVRDRSNIYNQGR